MKYSPPIPFVPNRSDDPEDATAYVADTLERSIPSTYELRMRLDPPVYAIATWRQVESHAGRGPGRVDDVIVR